MGKLNLTLPDPMHEWVEKRVRDGEYADESDYFGELVRDDQERHRALIDALIEGEESGISSRTVDDIIADGLAKLWPAAGFVDTEIRCLTELESGNAKKEVQPRVQA